MAAQLQIDQAGLPPGTPGVSRTDGLDTGALVTLTNTGAGATSFNLLWVPPGDTTAVASLASTGPSTWTFTPTAGVYGTYLIELVEDGDSVERRVLVVRTPNRGLIVPALNEIGDSKAFLTNDGAPQIQGADNNATDFTSDGTLNARPYAAWWRALHEFVSSLDDPDFLLGNVAPSNVTKSAAVVGVATTAARADHKHDVPTAAPVAVTKAAAAEGSASSLSRSDHKHDVSTGTAGAASVGDSALEGSATSLARSDHGHSFASAAPVDVTKAAASAGAATTFSRGDHKHDISTAVAGALSVGDAASEGSAASLSRSDHRHSIAVGAPADVTKATASDGVAAAFSRSDHKHDILTAAPVAIGQALSEGTSSAFARADHVHTKEGATVGATGYLARHAYVNPASAKLGQSYWGTTLVAEQTWTTASDIPPGNFFRIALVAGGGGGSTGKRNGRGGFGGGGGAWRVVTASRGQLIALLPLTLTVGLGGAGGAAITVSTGFPAGNLGATGSPTSLGPWAVFGGGGGNTNDGSTNSGGGGGGGGWRSAGLGSRTDSTVNTGGLPLGAASAGNTSTLETLSASLFGGGGGGSLSGTTAPGPGGYSFFGGGGGGSYAQSGSAAASPGGLSFHGGGGGGPGGFSSGAVGGAGGASGARPGGAGSAGGATSATGGAGADALDPFVSSGGGGGGSGGATNSGATATSGTGGPGGFPGGGGGGSGSATASDGTSSTSGAGGAGGDGVIVIETYT